MHAEIEWDILPVPSEEVLLEYAALIDAQDLHVLAAAPAVEDAHIPIRILTPGHFIRQVYPLQEDYPSLAARKGS